MNQKQDTTLSENKQSIVSELYNQFIIDAPRIRIFFEEQRESSSPECIFALILNNYDFSTGLRFLFWCTQTALAPIYKMKLEEINPNFNQFDKEPDIKYHLIDDGMQHIHISDETLILTKPFSICRIDEEGDTIMIQKLQLHITVFANNPSYMVEWKDISPPEKKKLKKERWIKVELVEKENQNDTIEYTKT